MPPIIFDMSPETQVWMRNIYVAAGMCDRLLGGQLQPIENEVVIPMMMARTYERWYNSLARPKGMTHPAKFLKAASDCAHSQHKFLDPVGIQHGILHEVDVGSTPGSTIL